MQKFPDDLLSYPPPKQSWKLEISDLKISINKFMGGASGSPTKILGLQFSSVLGFKLSGFSPFVFVCSGVVVEPRSGNFQIWKIPTSNFVWRGGGVLIRKLDFQVDNQPWAGSTCSNPPMPQSANVQVGQCPS